MFNHLNSNTHMTVIEWNLLLHSLFNCNIVKKNKKQNYPINDSFKRFANNETFHHGHHHYDHHHQSSTFSNNTIIIINIIIVINDNSYSQIMSPINQSISQSIKQSSVEKINEWNGISVCEHFLQPKHLLANHRSEATLVTSFESSFAQHLLLP